MTVRLLTRWSDLTASHRARPPLCVLHIALRSAPSISRSVPPTPSGAMATSTARPAVVAPSPHAAAEASVTPTALSPRGALSSDGFPALQHFHLWESRTMLVIVGGDKARRAFRLLSFDRSSP